ncbi:methionine synthase [uncultured Subdoligranulum sp.]|uniref:methionine synthase n=1 Tax=uncultured Subdoligranulum sp. TaxID=512298 RepID=UPI00262C584B|nr:methionine synthase [uncultured Subdoligranulum sp.]
MVRSTPPSIDRATALRYMGAAGWEPDAASAALLDRAEERLLQTATPRAVWRILPRTAVSLENRGRDLARHLQSCDRILLMAATLGSEVDTLLRRMELTDIALAATADAMASVLLEQVCDALEEELRAQLRAEGLYLTGRFAPGYGDCPLELNEEISLAVDSVRGCGLAVTAEHLLVPRKSTTALLGIADHPVTGAMAGCGTCHLRETCAFRKKGTTCFARN